MPELPEVETIRRTLEPQVVGKTIKKVTAYHLGALVDVDLDDLYKKLSGEIIEAIGRRGKYLIFKLTHYDLISHLRMEGKYEYHKKICAEDQKYQILKFNFTDGGQLIYKDVRKFGKFYLTKKNQALTQPFLKKIGSEPTVLDFSFPDFWVALSKRRMNIKMLLLAQEVVAGLGNIYVDEVLWQAKIHPLQAAWTLSHIEASNLHDSIIKTLANALEYGGTTVRSYLNAAGEKGSYQQFLRVYGKAGKPCPRCSTLIEKIKVGMRGTHYCPRCQKIRKRLPRHKLLIKRV